jgi:hypothetical protein
MRDGQISLLATIKRLVCEIYTPKDQPAEARNRIATIGHPFSLYLLRAPKILATGQMPLDLSYLYSIT